MVVTDPSPPHNWSLGELHAFCLICESRNLSQVALRLDMSQSAVSLMVRRWRGVIGDPLFVRSRYGVAPTDTALALYKRVQPLLEGLRQALAQPTGFDPAGSTRIFKLHLSDIGQLVFLPGLHAHINLKAPGVRLAIQSLRWEEVENGLASGDVDIAMGSLPMIKGRVHACTVRKERFFTIMRREHYVAKRKLDLAAFAEAEHLVIDAASSGHALVENVLRSKGVFRRIGLSVPHYLSAESLLMKSDYLLTLPAGGLAIIQHIDSFHLAPTPIQLPTFDIRIHWHERSRSDAGVQWLRDSIMELYSKG